MVKFKCIKIESAGFKSTKMSSDKFDISKLDPENPEDIIKFQAKAIKVGAKVLDKTNNANCAFVRAMLKRPDGKDIIELLDSKYNSQGLKPISEICVLTDQL